MNVANLSQLERPPIVEAVADFDCDMPIGFDLDSLQEELSHVLSSDYPRIEPIRQMGFTVQFDPSNTTSKAEDVLDALRFRSESGNQLVQYRRSGFSFNRIAPYSSLDDYIDEIENRWRQFLELAKPLALRTLRLRYINSINIPIEVGTADFTRYLNSASVLRGNGIMSGEFLSRLIVYDESKLLNGIVVTAVQAATESQVPVVVDIAVQTNPSCELDDMVKIMDSLRSLREFKNNVFASVITDECFNMLMEVA